MNVTMNRIGFGAALAAVGLGLGLLQGCSRGREAAASDDHHHDEEPGTAQITVWGERYEVFAEHRLVVAGVPTKFVTHVTDLQTLEPRAEGPVTFRMRPTGEPAIDPIEHDDRAPSRPGIYEPMLTFPKAGAWDLSLTVPHAGGDSTIVLPPIQVFADEHEAAHAEAPTAPGGITFLKEQQWKLRFQTGSVGERRLVERVALPAKALAKPGGRASVVAPLAGQLLAPPGGLVSLPGERVEAGQVLAVIQPVFSDAAERVVGIEAEFARARAALRQAEAAYERVQKLAAQQARSARELEEAEVALATAKARYEAAAALQATYRRPEIPAQTNAPAIPALELRAPIAGVINAPGAGAGETVAAGDTVFRLLNSEVLWIEARVPELVRERLAAAKAASFELPHARGRFIDIPATGGRFVFAGLEVDALTRTVPVLYEMDNREAGLLVGQALTLHVETTHTENALAVPESALVEEAGRPVVFVQVAGETFEKRDLALGIRDNEWVQVLSGLKAGERVVTQGAFAVRLASVSSTIPTHGHAH